MSWNHRVVRRVHPSLAGLDPEVRFGIHEAYYDDAGKVWACDRDASVSEESLADLGTTILRMMKALSTPVLEYDQIPEPGAKNPADDADAAEGV